MTKILTFDQAIEESDGKERTLLIGNGFSIAHFDYKTLLEKSGLDPTDPVRRLFETLNTVDFEVVIKALEDAAIVERTYNKEKRARILSSEAEKLRRALVHSIRVIHPQHREDIKDAIEKCAEFLLHFDTVFSLNYDLLLYWVILEDTNNFKDGFGLGEISAADDSLRVSKGRDATRTSPAARLIAA